MNRHIKKGIAVILDRLAWTGIGALIVSIVYLDMDVVWKSMILSLIVIVAMIYIGYQYYRTINELEVKRPDYSIQTVRKGIEKVVLLNEEKKVIKTFNISGKSGLVIGKTFENNIVDIDLSDLSVSQTISMEHAVMNYSNWNWYIEDSDSESGTAVRRSYENDIHYLNKSEQVKLESQDYIYIGKTILQVI